MPSMPMAANGTRPTTATGTMRELVTPMTASRSATAAIAQRRVRTHPHTAVRTSAANAQPTGSPALSGAHSW